MMNSTAGYLHNSLGKFTDNIILNFVYLLMRINRKVNKKDSNEFSPRSSAEPEHTLYGRLIKKYAPNHSFADICCMWGMHAKTAFYAESCGASRITAFDAMETTAEFNKARKDSNSRVQFVRGDIDHDKLSEIVGQHDVVWCTGLLYHTPDPFRVLSDILSVATKYAIIGSKTAPRLFGVPNSSIFLPGLIEHQRKKLLPFWGKNLEREFGTLPAWDYEWWWMLSSDTIKSMIEVHQGWKVIEVHERIRRGINDNCVLVAEKTETAVGVNPEVSSLSSKSISNLPGYAPP